MPLFVETPQKYFKSDSAVITGDVSIGEHSSFWFHTVVRGDVAPVKIGRRVNVQDGAVIHVDAGVPNVIGDDVLIGHRAVVHGMSVGDGAMIGMGAVVLSRTKIGKNCVVAAGAVLPPGLEVPDGMLVMGVPGRIARPVTEKELLYIRQVVERYVGLARRYVAGEFLGK